MKSLAVLALLSLQAHADTFNMKDGTSLEASIISETHSEYLLKAEVLNNVYAEKKVLKSDVLSIKKTDHSIAAFKKLANLVPTADLTSISAYENIINKQLKPFLAKYPESSHTEEVNSLLDTVNEEYHIVKVGGLKLNGKLITSDEIEADKYNVMATLEYKKFIDFARAKQYRLALITLSTLEKSYSQSTQCRQAQKLALRILPIYEAQLIKLHQNADNLMATRKSTLEGLNSSDQARSSKLLAAQEEKYHMELESVMKSKSKAKWFPINPVFKEPIEKNVKTIERETKRILAESEKPTVDAGSLYTMTYNALQEGDYESAKTAFNKFRRAKPPEELVNDLEQSLDEAKSVAKQMDKQKKQDAAMARKKASEERKKKAIEERMKKKAQK